MPDPTKKYKTGTSETLTNLGRNLASYFLGVKNTGTIPSPYKPTRAKNPDAKYSTWRYLKNDVKADITRQSYLDRINTQQRNFAEQDSSYLPSYVNEANFDQLYNYYSNSPKSYAVSGSSVNLGQYSVSPGQDDRGRYIGIHDTYDWDMFEGLLKNNAWETYDRIYEDEWDKIPSKKMQDGGKISNVPDKSKQRLDKIMNASKQWMQSYINSPKYKERLSNFYKYPDYIQRQRSNQLNNTQFQEVAGNTLQYDSDKNLLRISPAEINSANLNPSEVITHELGHVTNANGSNAALRLSPLEESYIFNRNNTDPQSRSDVMGAADRKFQTISEYLGNGPTHNLAPSENKSDIDAFRYLLNEQGLYDARTQDITPEILNKAKKNKAVQKSFSSQRLFQNFQDNQLLDIMNKVAYNQNADQNYAEYGKKLKRSRAAFGDSLEPIYYNNPYAVNSQLQKPIAYQPYQYEYSQPQYLQKSMNNISNYFDNESPNMVPNNASMRGTSFDQPEYLLNARSGKVSQSDYQPMGQPPSQQGGNKFSMPNIRLNTAGPILGLAALVNSVTQENESADEYARQARRNSMVQGYNPHPYGNGSQILFGNGGMIPSKKAWKPIKYKK